MAAQILGFGAFDSTNSAQILGTGPGICAVMGGERDARTIQIQFEISRAAWQHKFWDLVHSTAQVLHKLLNQVREFVLLWVVLASRTCPQYVSFFMGKKGI